MQYRQSEEKSWAYNEHPMFSTFPNQQCVTRSTLREDGVEKLVSTQLGRKSVLAKDLKDGLVQYCLEWRRDCMV